MSEHIVAPVADLADSGRLVVELAGREVGVFRIDGELRAYTNWCAHQGGPVCEGNLDGTTAARPASDGPGYELEWVKDDRVLRCPWHAWEFDALTGDCLHSDRYRLVAHDAWVEDGYVVVSL